eukprot:scaffold6752_cov89-Cylindrotheca_fusiformis.AAC.2
MGVWKERIKDHKGMGRPDVKQKKSPVECGSRFDPKRGLLFLEDGTTELMEDKSPVIEDENGSLSGERQVSLRRSLYWHGTGDSKRPRC